MSKIIIIVGPTASGKSDLANKLAIDLNLEIVNADAFQVYKELNVGINKPSLDDLSKIKHHFINSKSIFDEWNIKVFQDEFYKLINTNKNKNFIVCGGSNLYIDSIIKNYHLPLINKNLNFDNLSNDELWNKLVELDYEESQKINPHNIKRIKQALRIISSLNQKKSIKDKNNKTKEIDYIIISILIDREKLYEKINKRVYQMIKMDWIKEVKNLLSLYGYEKLNATNAFKAIGYNEVYESICNNKEIDINKIQQRTRQYAKRQITWIRNKFDIDYEYNYDMDNYNDILSKAKGFLNGK